LLDNIPDPAWLKGAEGQYLAVNAPLCRFFKLEASQILGRKLDDFLPRELAEAWTQHEQALMASRRPTCQEMEVGAQWGTPGSYEVWMSCLASPVGPVQATVGIARNISDRKRVERALGHSNRALRARSACTQVLVGAVDERDALGRVCRILVEQGGYRLAWVGVHLQDEAKTIVPIAQAGFDDGYLESAHITWADTERGQGPTGRCIRTRKPIVVLDVAADPSMGPWKEDALRRGYGATAAFPLMYGGELLGAMMVYAQSGSTFVEDEVSLLRALVDDLAFAVDAMRTRAAREKSEAELKLLNQELEARVVERTAEALDLYNNAPCGYHSIDADGLVLQMNDTELEWLGYRRAEVVGRMRLADLMSPRSAAQFARVLPGFVSSGSFSNVEWEWKRKDGSLFNVLIHASAVRDAGGRFLRTRSAALDITDRTRAEAALDAERRRLAGIIEGTGAGTWEWNIQNGQTSFNERWAEILGYTLTELAPTTQETWKRLVHEDDLLEVDDLLKRHFQGEVPYCVSEMRMRQRNGTWIWVLSRGRVTERDEAGRPVWMQGTLLDISERKRLEDGLRESESRYRAVFEGSLDAIITTDTEGRCLECNPAAVSIFRFASKEALLARHIWELSPVYQPDGQNSLYASSAIISRLITHGGQVIEWQHVRADGSLFPAEVSLNRCLVQGRWVLLGVIRDITLRKAAEVELRRSESKLRRLIELAPFAIGICNQAGEITYINARHFQTFGYTRDEIPTVDAWMERAYPDAGYREEVRRRWSEAVLRSEATQADSEAGEYHVTCRDGSVRQVLISGSPLGDESIVTFVDITRMKQTHEALQKLSLAVEYSPNMILITDETGRVEYVNPAWEACTGYQLAEVAGQRPRALKSGVHPREFYAHLWGEITAGRVWRGEFCNRRKNGELYWESAAIAPARDDGGRITHFIAVKEDITLKKQAALELQQAKEAADAANRAKSVFLANMSHEIRTPMNAILGFSQLLLRDAPTSGPQRDHLLTVMRSGEHLMDIINDILEIARIESGRVTLNVGAFNLQKVLDDLERMFKLRAESRKLQFRIERLGVLPQCIISDETKYRQVVINLLGNAMKFTPPGGSISLSVGVKQSVGDELVLHTEVVDTGVGVAEKDLPHLFEPFFQTDSGKQVSGGTGLGLPISQAFVRLMGGEFNVCSKPGSGSSFGFDIRVTRCDEHPPEPAQQRHRVVRLTPEARGCRVLAVDDQEENRSLLQALLEPVGFEVRSACNGQEGVDLCLQWAPHVVLMDLRMPVLDGYDAVKRIRQDPGPQPKIIAFSASAFADDRQRALSAGFDAFLAKPVDAGLLLDLIQSVSGLQYCYEDDLDAAPAAQASATAAPLESVDVLPPQWVVQFRQAILRAEYQQMLDLLDAIAVETPGLSRQFRSQVERFDYEGMLALLPAVSPPMDSTSLSQ
jgi:PAS domain S-box-containing protein